MSSNPTAYLVAGVRYSDAITMEAPVPATVTRYNEETGVPYEKKLPLQRRLFKTIDAEDDAIYSAFEQLGIEAFNWVFHSEAAVVGIVVATFSYSDMFPCVGKGSFTLAIDQAVIAEKLKQVQSILDSYNTGLVAEVHLTVGS